VAAVALAVGSLFAVPFEQATAVIDRAFRGPSGNMLRFAQSRSQ
jgi:hypothetical protein